MKEISNVMGVAVTLHIGIILFSALERETLRLSDFDKYVEIYLIPEQVYEANKYLRRGPMRIIMP